MAKTLHFQYVDRRLSIAKQLLLSLEPESVDMAPANALYREGVIDSAMLQMYFAVAHYINERLESYDLSSMNAEAFVISEDFFKKYNTVAEFVELKQLLLKRDSWLFILSCYPSRMMSQAETTRGVYTEKPVSQSQLIAIDSSVSDDKRALSVGRVLSLIKECSECIYRQREHMIEC